MSDPRNEVIYDKDFLGDVRKLPTVFQERLAELIEILREDPFDPRLHTKPLSAPLAGLFSFRIMRDYRAGFKFRASHTIQLIAVDRRDRIYQRLQRKR